MNTLNKFCIGKILLSAAFIITSVCLFSNQAIHSQEKSEKPESLKTKGLYGKIIQLKMNDKVQFDDSLTIILKSFSHKHPYIGGPTKATAYLSISKGTISDEILLSIHGVSGKSETQDGLSDAERYDSLLWNGYEIQLKGFNYDTSIDVIILKKK